MNSLHGQPVENFTAEQFRECFPQSCTADSCIDRIAGAGNSTDHRHKQGSHAPWKSLKTLDFSKTPEKSWKHLNLLCRSLRLLKMFLKKIDWSQSSRLSWLWAVQSREHVNVSVGLVFEQTRLPGPTCVAYCAGMCMLGYARRTLLVLASSVRVPWSIACFDLICNEYDESHY